MLGRHLQAVLERANIQVLAVSHVSTPGSDMAGWDLTEWRSLEELDALFDGVQGVVHAGAMVQTNGPIDEGRMFNTNVRACVNLGQWALSRGVPLVHISSSAVYSDTTSVDLNEDAPLAWSGLGGFYGLSKLLAEDALNRLVQQGLRLAMVRPSCLYGYGLPDTKMASSFLATAKVGGTIELVPPVHDRVDFIHATDVALAILAILRTESWDAFNIASGCMVSIKELADACISVTGRGRVSVNAENSPQRDAVTRFALNIDKATNRLGWRPSLNIRQGLSMTLQGCVYADDVQPS